MKFNWEYWLQITSNLAILVGIFLVLIELQQARDLTEAQLALDRANSRTEFHLSLAGDNPSSVLIRACMEPDNLSPEDKFVVAQVFQARLQHAMGKRNSENAGEFGNNYRGNLIGAFRSMFNYDYGKDYFLRTKELLPSEVREIGEEQFGFNRAPDCALGSAIPAGF